MRHAQLPQLTLFVIALGLSVVAMLGVALYALRRTFGKSRTDPTKTSSPRADDQVAFTLASLQGVIATLKQQNKFLGERCDDAERRAAQAGALFETLARELGLGLLVFSQQGFLILANDAARTLMGLDAWSRRKYSEVLGPESPLAARIRDGLENGTAARRELTELTTTAGAARPLAVTIIPCLGKKGEKFGIVCLISEADNARDDKPITGPTPAPDS